MNNVDLCLNEVYNVIPCEILNVVFHHEELSVREYLKQEVWDKVLLLDLDAYGGEKIDVSLAELPYDIRIDNGKQYRTYKIPKDRTRGKVITTILNIIHTPYFLNTPYNNGYYVGNMVNPAKASAQRAFNAVNASHNVIVTEAKLIGLNLVCAHFPNIFYGPDMFKMECIVQNDETLNNFDIKGMDVIVNMFVLATKRYIYNKLAIKMDQGVAIGGYEIGVFKELVDDYKDAGEEYNEEKKKIGLYSMLSNEKNRLDLFKAINSYR